MKSRNSVLAVVAGLFGVLHLFAWQFQDFGMVALGFFLIFPVSIAVTAFQPSLPPRRFGRGWLFLYLVAMAAMATRDLYLVMESWASC